MQQIVLEEPGRLTLVEADRAAARPGEALVRVRHVGVCGTDLHAFEGRQPYFTYPRILGHEIAAEVVDAPPGSGWQPGEACVVLPYLACGRCIACRAGRTNCCTTLKVLGVHVDGGLQEYLSVPPANLVRAEGLTAGQMSLVENQSIGAHAVRRAAVAEGEWVLVVGAGPIGLGVLQFARLSGARVIAADIDPGRLDFCRTQLGLEHVLDARQDLMHQVDALTGGDFPTAVFEATGSPGSMNAAFTLPAHGGRLVLVSLVQADITFRDPDFHRRELTVLSSRNATRVDFENVIAAMRTGQIVTGPLNTHRVTLAEAAAAFPGWLRREAGVIKAVVDL